MAHTFPRHHFTIGDRQNPQIPGDLYEVSVNVWEFLQPQGRSFRHDRRTSPIESLDICQKLLNIDQTLWALHKAVFLRWQLWVA